MPSYKQINVMPDGFPPDLDLRITKVTCNGIELTNEIRGFNLTIPDTEFKATHGDSRVGPGHTLAVQFTPTYKQPRRILSTGISSADFFKVASPKGKIAIFVESHFDEQEIRKYDVQIPAAGYAVEYVSYLWKNEFLYFTGNDYNDPLYVFKDLTTIDPNQYAGFIVTGAYAMDRLRYEENPTEGKSNQSPAVELIRKIATLPNKVLGVICHGLWLFTGATETIANRKVTCANNILYDVINAGAVPVYNAGGVGLVPTYVDKQDGAPVLVTGQHGGLVEPFTKVFLEQLALLGAPKV